MKQALRDDAEVQALAERMGAWPAIEASIRSGHSGSLIIGPWIFAYFMDGLVAIETSNPIEAAMLAAGIAAHLGGPITAGFASPQPPTAH